MSVRSWDQNFIRSECACVEIKLIRGIFVFVCMWNVDILDSCRLTYVDIVFDHSVRNHIDNYTSFDIVYT